MEAALALLLLPLIAILVYASMTPCPSCGSRGSVSWRYAKKGGGPDLRYSDNAQQCSSCGWASDAEDKAAALDAAHRALATAEAHLASLVARSEAERADLPVHGFIQLAKYVAAGDRRIQNSERAAVLRAVEALFPGRLKEDRVGAWFEGIQPDANRLEEWVAALRDDGSLPAALVALGQLAEADGKATKSEKDRLRQIQELGGARA